MPELAALFPSFLIRAGRQSVNQICIFFAAALQPKPSMPVQREGGETRGKEQKPSLPDAGEGKATLPSY